MRQVIHLLVTTTKGIERAAAYIGVGVTSIKTIRKENVTPNEISAVTILCVIRNAL